MKVRCFSPCVLHTFLSERVCSCVLAACVHYLFLLRPHPSSLSAGSEDSRGRRAAHTAAASLATPGRQTCRSTWFPAVKTFTKLHSSCSHGLYLWYTKSKRTLRSFEFSAPALIDNHLINLVSRFKRSLVGGRWSTKCSADYEAHTLDIFKLRVYARTFVFVSVLQLCRPMLWIE